VIFIKKLRDFMKNLMTKLNRLNFVLKNPPRILILLVMLWLL